MAKITEKIDLTINSYFAGDSDISLMPTRWRQHAEGVHRVFFFDELGGLMAFHISRIFPNFESLFRLREPEIDYSMSYYRIFKELPAAAYEEMLGYGDPNHCQMCGIPVNLLTRNDSHDSCERCYYRDTMQSNQLDIRKDK